MILSPLKRSVYRMLARRGKHDNWLAGLLFDLFERVYRLGDCSFEIPRDLTTRGFRARFFFNNYEREEAALVAAYVEPDDVVLELGGGIGVIACLTNRHLADPTQHVVVEANPTLLPWLRRNRDRNGCQFTIRHGLVSDTSDGTFYLHPLVVGGSATRTTATNITVPVLPYDTLHAERDRPFSVLVVDIEGGEYDFLKMHAPALRDIRLVLLELHDHIGILTAAQAVACRTCLRRAGLSRAQRIDNVEVWVRS